jgi:hypothetical protein
LLFAFATLNHIIFPFLVTHFTYDGLINLNSLSKAPLVNQLAGSTLALLTVSLGLSARLKSIKLK